MRRLLFAFFVLFVSSSCFAGDEEEITAVLLRNFEACNREDVDELLETCSVDMPDRKRFKRESIKLWEEKDIHYSLVGLEIVLLERDYAEAMIIQKTHSADRKHSGEQERFYRNGTALLPDAEVVKYKAAFKKDGAVWKCYVTLTEPEPVD